MQKDQEINFISIKGALNSCCQSETKCDSCTGKQCLVGFAKIVSDYAAVKKTLAIPNGIKMLPLQDFKTYEIDDVAKALAIINLECKNCMDNHDDNCVVNIIRSSLEVTVLGHHIEFSGNPLLYIMAMTQSNAEIGNKVMEYYNQLKKTAS